VSTSSLENSTQSSLTSASSLQSSSYSSAETTGVGTSKFTGELLRKEGNTIFVSGNSETRQYTISNDIKIRRDTIAVAAQELQVGDMLVVTATENSAKVLSIDVVSNKTLDYAKLIIPLLILGLLALVLLWYLYKKANKGHIRAETVTRK
jgi:hypothetical protein